MISSIHEFKVMHDRSTRSRGRRGSGIVAVAALLASFVVFPSMAFAQKAYEKPEAAFAELTTAIGADDVTALMKILGTQFEPRIVTPDWDAERPAREGIFEAAMHSQKLNRVSETEIEWVIGEGAWPFPIQLVRSDGGTWSFDTANGIEVVVERRIGRNELAAIEIVNAYVDAQIEYAKTDHDGDDVLEYAQRLASTKGRHDGLYWEAGEGEPGSPFGPLVADAESYLDTVAKGAPIHGYYFRVLEGQGKNPPGGEYGYVINGNMIAGFGLVAYPADYDNSGITTLVVNHRGVIQQKDLGPFEGMDLYDPDDTWTVVDPDTVDEPVEALVEAPVE